MKIKDYKEELKVIERSKPFLFVERHLFSIFVSILVIIYLFTKIEFRETMLYLGDVPLSFILIVFFINLLMYALSIFRWRIIIQKISKIGYFVLFPIFFVGGLINQLTPGTKSGGQPLRAYYLTKLNKKDYADNLATVLFEFFSGSFTSFVLLVFSLFYLSRRFQFKVYYSIVIFLVLSILMVLFLIYLTYKIEIKSKIARRMLSLIYKIRFIKKRYKTFVMFENNVFRGAREFFKESFIFLKDSSLVLKQMFIEFMVYLLEFLKVYLLFMALGVDVPFMVVAVISVISQMVGFLFFSPGGLGAVEGTMVGLYYLFGISPEIAAAVTIINRIMIYLYEFLFGYISLIYLRSKHKE